MRASTLQQTEASLGPLVGATHGVLALACLAMLFGAWSASACAGARLAVALSGMVFVASWCLSVANVVRTGHTTIGSVPVALGALTPLAATTALLVRGPSRLLAMALFVLGLAVTAFLARWFRLMGAACRADATLGDDAVLICLGGAVAGGRPLPTLRSRLDTCLAMAREGEGRYVVCTGAAAPGEDESEAEVMRRYLVSRGFDEGRILVEDTAKTTRENVERSVALVREAGLGGELVVCTSDFHVLRAIWEGRRCGVRLTGVPARTPAPSRLEQWSREALTCAFHGVRPT